MLFKEKWKGIEYYGCIDITSIRLNEMKEYIEKNKEPGYRIDEINYKIILFEILGFYIWYTFFYKYFNNILIIFIFLLIKWTFELHLYKKLAFFCP